MNLECPADDGARYPSLGRQVVDWMEEYLVFGPGDLRGQPLRLDQEQQAFIWRFYELYPKGHPLAGRRRFMRCALSLAKGLRKTELAACVAAAELHPDAPVRFNGWRGKGLAPGRGVNDPFVVLVAYTEEQSDELCFAALRTILEKGPLKDDFDIGLERIIHKSGAGKAISVANSPSANDGARTTFQCFDETHRFTLPKQRATVQTMNANLPKRVISEAWGLEITTAPEPGAGSVAESTMDYAKGVIAGKVKDATLFFYHRQAGDEHDLTTVEGARAAVIEASGVAASWRNIDGVMALWAAPDTDRAFWERVWTNRLVQQTSQAFDVKVWDSLKRPDNPVKRQGVIVIGFDGSLFHDSTAIVCTDVKTGYQWIAGLWERPENAKDWKVPEEEVDEVIKSLFSQYTVWRLYADPPHWNSWISKWRGMFGEERVIDWHTSRRQMAGAIEGYDTAIRTGLVCHGGDARFKRHLGNARRQALPGNQVDEQGQPLWVIKKERHDSPQKMDVAVAGALSWEARSDAIAAGVQTDPFSGLVRNLAEFL